MKVLVDTPADRGWRLGANAHMLPWDNTPEALEQLHATAKTLGLRPAWFQAGRWPHYDLTLARYTQAVLLPQVQRTTTRGYLVFRRVLPHNRFVEPGTGLRMWLDRWYVITDDGRFHTTEAFSDTQAALRWCQRTIRCVMEDNGDVMVWQPSDPSVGFTNPASANIVRGLDMLLFWAANDSFTLSQTNPRS